MGGIADYSGSLVLQMPIAEGTSARVALSDGPVFSIVSVTAASDSRRHFAMPASEAEKVLADYEAARAYFRTHADDQWVSYVLGCLVVLHVEEDMPWPPGLSIHVESDVPEGKGVSSSAALEVSVMGALLALFGKHLELERIARLCQIVENYVAGAPCGIMDQMTATCGRARHLLALLCQPADVQGHLALPPDIAFWGIDSGVRHSVGGSDYVTVRTAAAMGYRIIAEREGMPVRPGSEGHVAIDDDTYRGYLANLGPEGLKRHQAALPERMSGSDFLDAYGGVSDAAVSVDRSRTYPVRAATAHPVLEHDRVTRLARLIERDLSPKILAMMGELMYLSHASYTACGLGSPGTDRLVDLVKESGYRSGLYGARITGGGSGGTVAVLARREAADAIRRVARTYSSETGYPIRVFEGSSDGLRVTTAGV